MTTDVINPRRPQIRTARAWVEQKNLLILDTETTGLDSEAQIVEIAIIDLEGRPILNTLVKPTCPIPQKAIDIHHITDDMVASAPAFVDLWPLLRALLRGRLLLSYGASFDFRLIQQSLLKAEAATRQDLETIATWPTGCIMTLYADYYGEWSDYHGSNKFQKLTTAAGQCGIQLEGRAHGALYDAELARRVLLHLAAQEAT